MPTDLSTVTERRDGVEILRASVVPSDFVAHMLEVACPAPAFDLYGGAAEAVVAARGLLARREVEAPPSSSA